MIVKMTRELKRKWMNTLGCLSKKRCKKEQKGAEYNN